MSTKALLTLLTLCLGLTACINDPKEEPSSAFGFLSLQVGLEANENALFKVTKAASADTQFSLDSVKIVLTAPGSLTQTYSYALNARADTGNISLSPRIYPLAALRAWKAKIYSLDTTLNPSRTDTVHVDSVSFEVKPGDTTLVNKNVNPVFSILRVRLVSNSPASIANTVKYVRIRVDGVTRDSIPIGPELRAVSYGNGSTGCIVGENGAILRSTNEGDNWTSVTSGTSADLLALDFPATNTGWAVGAGGTVVKTTTGTSWSAQSSGTAQDLNGVSFSSTSLGYAVGNAGTIRKSNGATWSSVTSSGTANHLYAVHAANSTTAYAVGAAGTVVRTVNSGTTWLAQNSGTTQTLRGVFFTSASAGYAVGNGGTILKTSNSGTTWTTLTSGTTKNLNSIYFATSNKGWAVGEDGTLLYTTNATSWTALASGTTQHLWSVAFTTDDSDGSAVGAAGAISGTANDITWAFEPSGTKTFDTQLTYKYLKPNMSHTIVMDAIDTLAGALRGYQAVKTVSLGAGKDSTVTPASSVVKCGYAGFSSCTP